MDAEDALEPHFSCLKSGLAKPFSIRKARDAAWQTVCRHVMGPAAENELLAGAEQILVRRLEAAGGAEVLGTQS